MPVGRSCKEGAPPVKSKSQLFADEGQPWVDELSLGYTLESCRGLKKKKMPVLGIHGKEKNSDFIVDVEVGKVETGFGVSESSEDET